MYNDYKQYLSLFGEDEWTRSVNEHKWDLRESAINSPDYHKDVKRNGIVQPMLLTRGGEQHSYNIICLPGDSICAGDDIEVFGSHWLVMEARADNTTHQTGVMYQCNHLFRFQNFSPDICEYWGILDQSGYSSTVRGTDQVQRGEEQLAIYLPYNEDTAKIYVDKRLASHIGYEQTGRRILESFKVTSCAPNTHSFNPGDHLLMIKVIRDLYNETTDNMMEMICDYIPPLPVDPEDNIPEPELLKCEISGKPFIQLRRTKTFTSVFYADDGETINDDVDPVWTYDDVPGINLSVVDNSLRVQIDDDSNLIGETFHITLSDAAGIYEPATLEVEVRNFV